MGAIQNFKLLAYCVVMQPAISLCLHALHFCASRTRQSAQLVVSLPGCKPVLLTMVSNTSSLCGSLQASASLPCTSRHRCMYSGLQRAPRPLASYQSYSFMFHGCLHFGKIEQYSRIFNDSVL